MELMQAWKERLQSRMIPRFQILKEGRNGAAVQVKEEGSKGATAISSVLLLLSLRKIEWHPDFYDLQAVDEGQREELVGCFGTEIELCVISIWVQTKTMLLDDLNMWICSESPWSDNEHFCSDAYLCHSNDSFGVITSLSEVNQSRTVFSLHCFLILPYIPVC